MKKYLFTQAKKSLSLMMAILMLLSCWVWVAPTEAEAADYDNGKYYVKYVASKIREAGNDGGWDSSGNKLTIKWVKADGTTGSTGAMSLTKSKYTSEGATDVVIWEGYIDGFPTEAGWYMKMNHKSGESRYLSVGGCFLVVGKNADDCKFTVTARGDDGSATSVTGNVITNLDAFKWQCDATQGGTKDATFSIYKNSGDPQANSFVVDNKAAALTIPDLTDTSKTNTTTSAITAKVYDQYGVWMYNQYATYALKDEAGTTDYNKDNHGIWTNKSGNGVTVSVNYLAQTKITGDPKTKTATAKVIGSYTHDSNGKIAATELATITLNYPTYIITVDQKLGATMTLSNGEKQTTSWSYEGIYGAEAPQYPISGMEDGVSLGATKSGYTFKGYWTVPQPDSGDANYNAESANFASPISETTFNSYKNLEGAVVSGNFVTVNGAKFYNAGKEWNADIDFAVTGVANYYGWWVSKDIVVKFYDIDGTYLGSKTTKLGKKEAASWYADPKDSYNAGAFQYETFSGKWMDITGKVIEEGEYTFGDLESLTLTPVYSKKTYNNKYQIDFIDPINGGVIDEEPANGIASGEYEYRHVLNKEDGNIPDVSIPTVLKNDNAMTYVFSGWTTQKPASGNYHKVAVDDSAVVENTDWAVKADATYYAVYRGTVKEYLVSFTYTDTKGDKQTIVQTVAYGSTIKTPNEVNRTYAAEGKGYVLQGWNYKSKSEGTIMLGVDAAVVLNDTNVSITASNLATAATENPIKFTAKYDDGTPTPYNVTFKYKNGKGEDVEITDLVFHGSTITQAIVDRVTVPKEYDDGAALYTFAKQWKVTEGNADKEYYTTEEFTSFGPTSHVTFEAVYGEGVPFYTVTYHNGAVTYTERVLEGLNVPAWMIETGELDENGEPIMKEYEPEGYKDEKGEYSFAGWFDAEQTDKKFNETNGNQYTTASIVEGNLDLYAQYTFEPFKFTIKFMNYNGTEVLAETEVEAGASYESTLKAAEAEAEKRAADETYSYTFIGWDYKVPVNYLCEGKDITYTAQYRPSYVYYTIRWYNDLKSMSNADFEMEIVGEDGLLAKTSQTYEGAVYAPTVELTPPTSDDASVTWVFDGWYYLNNGVETAYQRGLKITDSMSFYAKYKDEKNALTFTTVVNGESTNIEVAYGEKVTVGDPADGYVDAANHNDFIGWYNADDTAFDFDTAITENTTIYAKFTVSAHDRAFKELVSVPTYYAAGSEKIWCACDKENTTKTVEIPMLTDTVAPTGTIYLGTQGKWSSTDEVGAAATDNDEVTYFANADTDIILTINDTGDVNDLYNPSGAGKGIQVIQGIISKGVFGAGTTELAGIQTLFNAETDSEDLNNTENFVIRLGSYEGLEHGETYIAYYYVKDKAGNVLNTKVRTAKFIYDTEAPEFELEGIGNGKTYCGEVTVTGIEEGATVTVNGAAVEYTGNTYKIVGEGNYIIKVIDRAGNVSAAKKVTVAAGHNTVKTTQAATCVADGYEKVTCIVCDDVISNISIPSDGHKYSEVTTVVPTCTEGGYDIKVCSVCGDEVKTDVKPAEGHKYETDDNNKIIYTVVTAATCKTDGKKIANCTVCGKGTKTETIEADTENGHVYGPIKVLKATCTAKGKEYKNCKYCLVEKHVSDLDMIEHGASGSYTTVTTEATCYSEGKKTEYCKACDEEIETTTIAMKAHTLVLKKYDTYMQYECQVSGCKHTEGREEIAVKATYTVTFKGAGENNADLEITKTEGESIAEGTVADLTKDQDDEYKYTFAGWKGTDGKIVKLPIKVTKNETYTAEFTATKRIYTHKFYVEEGKEFASIIGTYNDADKKPMSVPTKPTSEDGTETYTFAAWLKDGKVAKEDDFTMTEDASFYASFTTTLKKYNVIFYNEADYFYGVSDVEAGSSVSYTGEAPTKAPDTQYHYTFAGWLKDGKLYADGATEITITGIKADTRIYASYAKAAHVYSEDVSFNDATCTESGKKVTKCTCGVEFVEIIPAKGHDHSVILENGAKQCSRCDNTIAPEAKKVTLTFKDAYDKLIKSVKVTEGESYTIEAPVKASDAKNDYSFKNWTVDGAVVGTDAKLTVKAGTTDATYIANYNEAIRSYYVTYVNWNYDVLQTVVLEYGATIPAYSKADPKRDPSDTHHYDFAGWEGYTAGMTVTGPTQFKAQYTASEHNLNKLVVVEASCTTPYTTYNCCDHDGCEYREAKDTVGSTVAHTPNKAGYTENKAPALGKPGSKKFVCAMCGEEITETIPEIPADEIIIIIYNNSGVLATHGSAHVTLYEIVDGEAVIFNTTPVDTDANGRVTFTVEKGKTWRVGITGDDINGGYGGSVKAGTNKFGTAAEEVEKPAEDECSCNCHKNTFWGMIFRFFQKIIKKLTGKAKCCDDPSSKI